MLFATLCFLHDFAHELPFRFVGLHQIEAEGNILRRGVSEVVQVGHQAAARVLGVEAEGFLYDAFHHRAAPVLVALDGEDGRFVGRVHGFGFRQVPVAGVDAAADLHQPVLADEVPGARHPPVQFLNGLFRLDLEGAPFELGHVLELLLRTVLDDVVDRGAARYALAVLLLQRVRDLLGGHPEGVLAEDLVLEPEHDFGLEGPCAVGCLKDIPRRDSVDVVGLLEGAPLVLPADAEGHGNFLAGLEDRGLVHDALELADESLAVEVHVEERHTVFLDGDFKFVPLDFVSSRAAVVVGDKRAPVLGGELDQFQQLDLAAFHGGAGLGNFLEDEAVAAGVLGALSVPVLENALGDQAPARVQLRGDAEAVHALLLRGDARVDNVPGVAGRVLRQRHGRARKFFPGHGPHRVFRHFGSGHGALRQKLVHGQRLFFFLWAETLFLGGHRENKGL